jgi:hypothetical protein
MITESAILTDTEQNEIANKQRAELYQRIYKYAAEDFASHPDLKAFAQDVLRWMRSVEDTLTKTHQAMATHTHRILPHFHGIQPHIHYSGSGPTSVGIGGNITLGTPIVTPPPHNAAAIRWTKVSPIKLPSNTTGAQSNMSGNKIIGGTIGAGDVQTGSQQRRMKVPSILIKPSLPPYMRLTVP